MAARAAAAWAISLAVEVGELAVDEVADDVDGPLEQDAAEVETVEEAAEEEADAAAARRSISLMRL